MSERMERLGIIERLGTAIESLEDLKIIDIEIEHFKINSCIDLLKENIEKLKNNMGDLIEG